MDYVCGDYSAGVRGRRQKAGVCECPAPRSHQPAGATGRTSVLEEFVVRAEPAIKQLAVTAGRDINMFRYWFYQPRQ